MTRARRGELTARRHVRLPQRLSVKAQFTFDRSSSIYVSMLQGTAVILARRVQHLQLAEDTAEQQECHQPSAPAGSVSSFSSSVYWHSYVEAALLQLAPFFATLAWVSTSIRQKLFVETPVFSVAP